MIVDRKKERKLFQEFSDLRIGPKTYFDNETFRIEEWIDAVPVKGSEIKVNRRHLAKKLAEFHNIKIDWIAKVRYLPNDLNDDNFLKPFYSKISQISLFTPDELELIEKLKKLVEEEEILFLKSVIPLENDLVLSHNDLSLGNMLINEKGNIWLIDYEYAGKNFRGFDIGYLFHQSRFNRINEPPFLKLIDDYFPSDEELLDFLRYYIFFND